MYVGESTHILKTLKAFSFFNTAKKGAVVPKLMYVLAKKEIVRERLHSTQLLRTQMFIYSRVLRIFCFCFFFLLLFLTRNGVKFNRHTKQDRHMKKIYIRKYF